MALDRRGLILVRVRATIIYTDEYGPSLTTNPFILPVRGRATSDWLQISRGTAAYGRSVVGEWCVEQRESVVWQLADHTVGLPANWGYPSEMNNLHLDRAHGSERWRIGPSVRAAFNFLVLAVFGDGDRDNLGWFRKSKSFVHKLATGGKKSVYARDRM